MEHRATHLTRMDGWTGRVAQVVEHLQTKKVVRPDAVTHICNPSYSRGQDGEESSSRPAWAKKGTRNQSQSQLGQKHKWEVCSLS
jgi:hypothetical protein